MALLALVTLFMACTGSETPPAQSPATIAPAPTAAATQAPAATDDALPTVPVDTTPIQVATIAPAATPAPTAVARPTGTTSPAGTPEADFLDNASVEGSWEGVNTLPGLGEFELVVKLSQSENGLRGTMDIPAQNAFGLELADVSFESGRLRLELDSPIGLAVWEGEVRDGVFEGDFTQGSVQGTFRLEPTELSAGSSQPYEAGTTSYRREEVSFFNGDVVLAGDLTFPEGEGPFPAVILISGSGNQDRDSNLFGFKLFDVMTRHLERNGIAVLRFDDRGVGGSGGDGLQSTLNDRAGDVEAAVELLLSRADVNGEQIGLIGHSEGGLVALLVANHADDVDFAALLAVPSVRGDELLRAQLVEILRLSGATREQIENARSRQELTLRTVLSGVGWDDVAESVRQSAREEIEALPEQMRQSLGDIDAYLDTAVAQQLNSLQSPWFKSFVEYDPKPDIVALDVPVLALYGVLDILVPVDINSTAMSEALGESNVPSHTLASLWPANHLFQSAETGSLEEYASLEPEFIPEFLDFLLEWLAKQTNNP